MGKRLGRRHHNNKGYRQIKRGKTRSQVEVMAKRLGVPYGTERDCICGDMPPGGVWEDWNRPPKGCPLHDPALNSHLPRTERERKMIEKTKEWVKLQLASHTSACMCEDCKAARATKEAMERHGQWDA